MTPSVGSTGPGSAGMAPKRTIELKISFFTQAKPVGVRSMTLAWM